MTGVHTSFHARMDRIYTFHRTEQGPMNHSKAYVVDTNVLLDDPGALFKLRNGNENNVFIPYHVLLELNKFKKDPRLGHVVAKVIRHLSDHSDQFTILSTKEVAPPFA